MSELIKCVGCGPALGVRVVGGGIGLSVLSAIVTIPIMWIITYNLSVDIEWKIISIVMQVSAYVGGLVGLLAFVAEKSDNEKKI